MRGKPGFKLRIAAAVLVLFLLTGCFGIGSELANRKAVEAEIASFQKNVTTMSLEGYNALAAQFTNPFNYTVSEEDMAEIYAIIDSATAELLMPILQNPELYDPEMVPNSHFNDEMDALFALYDAKGGDLQDPELNAAMHKFIEQFYLYQLLCLVDAGIYALENDLMDDDIEDIMDGYEPDEARILAWLELSEFTDTGYQLPKAAVLMLMLDTELTWGDAVLEQSGRQWIAELPFSFAVPDYLDEEPSQMSGSYFLTFVKQRGKWRITEASRTLSDLFM